MENKMKKIAAVMTAVLAVSASGMFPCPLTAVTASAENRIVVADEEEEYVGDVDDDFEEEIDEDENEIDEDEIDEDEEEDEDEDFPVRIDGVTSVPKHIALKSAVSVKGKVTSDVKITELTAGVYDTSGKLITGKTVKGSAYGFDLKNIDKYILFDSLKDGAYIFRITAVTADGNSGVLTSQKFTVGSVKTFPEDYDDTDDYTEDDDIESDDDESESIFEISDETVVPEQLQKGKCFSVKGIITSSEKIYTVTVGVYKTNGKLVTGRTVHPNTKRYDIHEVDKYILFDKLATGDYVYRVTAASEDGETEVLTEKNFTVTASVSKSSARSASPKYIDGILVVNKSYPLPEDYNPGGLTSETQKAFDKMADAAKNDGIKLTICSGFRSYSYQKQLYERYVAENGQKEADRFSARPGHSEHQTGMAIDVNNASSSFDGTPEAKWLEQNCYNYGFIIRYPKGKEDITGYRYESWHIRYLGTEKSVELQKSGLTLEEYLDIDSVYAE